MEAQREVADDVEEEAADDGVLAPVAGERLDPFVERLQQLRHRYLPIIVNAAQ
jgi:hypothetical protein